jgi:N-acetylmuramoyl-L-alanine amidase
MNFLKNLHKKIKHIIIIIGIFMSFPLFFPCELNAAPYIRYKTCYGEKYVYLSDLASFYGMTLTKRHDGCEIRNKNSAFSFTFEKRTGLYNGVKIHYLYASCIVGSEPLISEKDYKFIIDPLVRGPKQPRGKVIKTIVIDPGHGGKDDGAEAEGNKEKNLVFIIAKKLRDKLRAKGFNVYLTREKDVFIDLDNRPAKAKTYKADIFISIHCNAAADKQVKGLETFCLTPEGAPSTSDKNSKSSAFQGNKFNKENICLAYLVQRCVLGNTGAADRGIKHARFAVIKGAPCPAVLIETGFLTNAREGKNLAWSKYQDGIADGIAEGISYYARLH